MADEGFREIQLQGKQLVFLFMAATVVAVVVFLCGVMVGRGVQGTAAGAVEQASLYPGAAGQDPSPARAASMDGNAPLTAQETLTYSELLENPEPVAETFSPGTEPAQVVSEPVVLTEPESVLAQAEPVVPTPSAAAAQPASLAEPPGSGFVVQVAAVRQRAQADAIASGLSAKGYPAFVSVSGPNFRVRVGKYADRGEAESVAGRLAREEQFDPWITR